MGRLDSGLAVRIRMVSDDGSGRQDILGSGGGNLEHDVLIGVYTRSQLLFQRCAGCPALVWAISRTSPMSPWGMQRRGVPLPVCQISPSSSQVNGKAALFESIS